VLRRHDAPGASIKIVRACFAAMVSFKDGNLKIRKAVRALFELPTIVYLLRRSAAIKIQAVSTSEMKAMLNPTLQP
jgi:hypothetical protein